MILRFFVNSEKCREYTFLGEVIEIYYNITWGGLPDWLQYYKGGGGLSGPQNLYYVIYGRPPSDKKTLRNSLDMFIKSLAEGVNSFLCNLNKKKHL